MALRMWEINPVRRSANSRHASSWNYLIQEHHIGSSGADMLSLRKSILVLIAVLGIAVSSPGQAVAEEKSIVVASTTSTEDTGLFGHLLPLFTMKTGIAVKVLAVGTGQALDIARRGDADVVFVHNKSAEQTFVAEAAYQLLRSARSANSRHRLAISS